MSASLNVMQQNNVLVIASHNPGKVREIGNHLAPLGIPVISAGELELPEPEETGLTFVENSQLKAIEIAQGSGKMALADDSGLCVDALNGAPGIYSGRWAEATSGGPRDFNIAFKKLFDALIEIEAPAPYRAKMVCVLSVATPSGKTQSFEGIIRGTLSLPPRGENGFGYDPIFTPDGHSQTFAEMDPTLKAKISHRKKAFELLMNELPGLMQS